MIRILFLMMLPFVCFSQITPREDIQVNSKLIEKENLDTKRKASYNLDEIKVRWKKAALENCPGVPCIVTPPAPSFTCGTSTVTDVDNNIYYTVAIGTGTTAQCWTKTNLRVTKYNDGTPIPDETANNSWGILLNGARTNYTAGVIGYVNTFGYLYNWYAAAGIITNGGFPTKNICPTGWHVPTDSDWNKLVKFIDSGADTSGIFTITQSNIAGGKMKSTATNTFAGTGFGWNPATTTPSPGTDDFGFSALPGGFRSSGAGSNLSEDAYFWTATPVPVTSNSYLRKLNKNSGNVDSFDDDNSLGFSVRCLKD
jgi:uncharacterized protein (TIGR02145 family)